MTPITKAVFPVAGLGTRFLDDVAKGESMIAITSSKTLNGPRQLNAVNYI